MAYHSEREMIEHRDRIRAGIEEILNDFGDNRVGAVNSLVAEIQNNYNDGFKSGVECSKKAIDQLIT